MNVIETTAAAQMKTALSRAAGKPTAARRFRLVTVSGLFYRVVLTLLQNDGGGQAAGCS